MWPVGVWRAEAEAEADLWRLFAVEVWGLVVDVVVDVVRVSGLLELALRLGAAFRLPRITWTPSRLFVSLLARRPGAGRLTRRVVVPPLASGSTTS